MSEAAVFDSLTGTVRFAPPSLLQTAVDLLLRSRIWGDQAAGASDRKSDNPVPQLLNPAGGESEIAVDLFGGGQGQQCDAFRSGGGLCLFPGRVHRFQRCDTPGMAGADFFLQRIQGIRPLQSLFKCRHFRQWRLVEFALFEERVHLPAQGPHIKKKVGQTLGNLFNDSRFSSKLQFQQVGQSVLGISQTLVGCVQSGRLVVGDLAFRRVRIVFAVRMSLRTERMKPAF